MARSSLHRDFFSLEKESTPPILQRRRSFRDIQGVITKMNPEIVKSVIANETQKKSNVFPVGDPTLSLSCGYEKKAETAPMTIFYNGVVAVFDMPPAKAKHILKAAGEKNPKPDEFSDSSPRNCGKQNLLQCFHGDLPLTRKNSLQRFLEKRRERLISIPCFHAQQAKWGVPL